MEFLIGGPIPPLRKDLEMTSTEHDGKPMLILSDIVGLQEETFLVSPGAVLIASLFDGKKKTSEIQAELTKHKVVISHDEINKLCQGLDQHGLLETSVTAKKRKRSFEEFKNSPIRKFHAKARGLPEDPLQMAGFLGKFSRDSKRPGENQADNSTGRSLIGLVSPHIDLFRGGASYARSYEELKKSSPPDIIVAVGVAHISPNSPWVMSKKSYETPFGPMEVDETLYEEIRKTLWYDPTEEEWIHAKEHSLEFQALWLKYIWRQDAPRWVPILCSNYERFCINAPPSAIPTIEEAIQKIGQILSERTQKGQRILVLAGIDLAHVGHRFGDEMDITDELKKKIEDSDRKSLESALEMKADLFFMSGIGNGAWRKVCGLSSLYTSLRWIKNISNGKQVTGQLLSYDQAPDPMGGLVSFASLKFEL